jgi:hypothetical protein
MPMLSEIGVRKCYRVCVEASLACRMCRAHSSHGVPWPTYVSRHVVRPTAVSTSCTSLPCRCIRGCTMASAKSSVCIVLVVGCYVKAPIHRLYGAGCLNMIHNILAPLGFMGRMLKSKSRISSVVVGRVGLDASCGFMRNVVVCVGCLEFGLCSREAIRYDIDWCGDYIQSSGCGSPCIGFDPMEEANLLTASLHLQYK